MKKYSHSLLFFLLINSISNSFSQGLNDISDYEFEKYGIPDDDVTIVVIKKN